MSASLQSANHSSAPSLRNIFERCAMAGMGLSTLFIPLLTTGASTSLKPALLAASIFTSTLIGSYVFISALKNDYKQSLNENLKNDAVSKLALSLILSTLIATTLAAASYRAEGFETKFKNAKPNMPDEKLEATPADLYCKDQKSGTKILPVIRGETRALICP